MSPSKFVKLRTKSALGTLILLSLIPGSAFAAKFANQFTEFELPPRWQCNLEGAEWVCQNTDEKKKKDAIIVLAAKLKGDQDSLDNYLAYLKNNKSYTSVHGKPVKSESKYAKYVKLNGHAWVDSLHLESELPGFYTRYLATVQQDIGVLVTYSINKDKYQEYLDDFETMVKTLKVFRKAGGLNANSRGSDLFKNTNIPQHVAQGTVFPDATVFDQTGTEESQPEKKQDDLPLLPLLLIGAAVGYIIWRKKQAS